MPCEPRHHFVVRGLTGIVKPPGGGARRASRRGGYKGAFFRMAHLTKTTVAYVDRFRPDFDSS
jgi:hypothetical protein